jgi:dolichyl-diphosphooligosaccharide--protein glycosyltransferase
MISVRYDKKILSLVAVVLIILSIFALIIRALPLLNLGSTDILNIVASDDPLYNLRQIEQMLVNYPTYNWFDVMTLYPVGQDIPWGPMFNWITTSVTMLVGATSRDEIISIALWVPPLLAAFMVPVMFMLVRKAWNWKAGLLAAVFITVVGGQFFFRSLAGYLDHHIAEVLFSTIFCLTYIYALAFMRDHPVDLRIKETWKMPFLFSCLAGFGYILGFLTMPTMVLFAFIVALTTIALFIIDFYHGRTSEYLVILNTVTFGLAAIIGMILTVISGGLSQGLGLYFYNLSHPISYIFLIIGTGILYWLSKYLKGKNKLYFPVSVVGLGIVSFLILFVLLPNLYDVFISGIEVFFGFNPFAATVQEARPWTLAEAWQVFNFGLILMVGGVIVLLYKGWKEYRAEHIFVLVWSVFIIIAAFRQVRYEYYLAVNIALLGGICVGYCLERAWPDIRAMGKRASVKEPEEEVKEERGSAKKKKADKAAKKTAKKTGSKPDINYLNILIAGLVCAFAVIFAVTSVQLQYAVASSGGIRMNQDWRESLEWMNVNTPETGVDYYKLYDKDTFTYPETAYGVMSWWDYGHMITYIANRIPNSNPFQAGVAGPNGSASFFMSQSEAGTNQIADNQGTRYIMTDYEMATGKFWAMATWYNSTEKQGPYQPIYFIPDSENPGSYKPITIYTDQYFMTTISRLHNFDGSYTPAGEVYYIEYTTTLGSKSDQAVITSAAVMDVDQAKAAAAQYNQQAQPGTGAAVISTLFIQTTTDLPAMHHYRLVHESPTDLFYDSAPDLKYVKVFEYVPGARIKGEGIIELPVVTNTGRQLTWRAESVNGEFIVPYSTEGNPYDVRATGKYRIVGTGREFSVSEDAIMRGLQIS